MAQKAHRWMFALCNEWVFQKSIQIELTSLNLKEEELILLRLLLIYLWRSQKGFSEYENTGTSFSFSNTVPKIRGIRLEIRTTFQKLYETRQWYQLNQNSEVRFSFAEKSQCFYQNFIINQNFIRKDGKIFWADTKNLRKFGKVRLKISNRRWE